MFLYLPTSTDESCSHISDAQHHMNYKLQLTLNHTTNDRLPKQKIINLVSKLVHHHINNLYSATRTWTRLMNVKNTQEKRGAQTSWSRAVFVITAFELFGSSGKTVPSSVVYQTWPGDGCKEWLASSLHCKHGWIVWQTNTCIITYINILTP